MSKYSYPSWHDIKDLAMIYHEDEWDNARVKVWDPIRQREYELVFTGSSRPQGEEPGEINFNIEPSPWIWKDEIRWWVTLKLIKFKYILNKKR